MEYINSFNASLFLTLSEPPMAHVSCTIGHHILLIGGYRISYENDIRTITAFDKHDILMYDVISHQLSTLEVKFDNESIGSFPREFFCSSGMASATYDNRIYLFGGYSLSKLEAGNALYFIEVVKKVSDDNVIDIGRLCDRKVDARLVFLAGSHEGSEEIEHIMYPSYRDKASMVYWEGQLIVFGGYGCHFRIGESSESSAHDFLGSHGEYVVGSGNRGWTNQLLVYSLVHRTWTNPSASGPVPCPRAAHSAAVSGHRMFVFGGRLGVRNTAMTIRCNQLYHLDLVNFVWSQVQLQDNGLVGRSWTSFTPLSSHRFFIVGGFSGDNEPLADAHIISVNDNYDRGVIVSRAKCMEHASWAPMMDISSWGLSPAVLGDPLSRMWHSTSLAPDGRIYIFGGCQNNLIFEIERIQSVVERLRASPDTLYRLCLWAFVTSRPLLTPATLSQTIVADIMHLTL